jgi:uncharacterized membrane protein YgcG
MKLKLSSPRRVLNLTVLIVFCSLFFYGCAKKESDSVTYAGQEQLLNAIANDPDFRPIAYMLNNDYIQLRRSLHESKDSEGRAKELLRATSYIATYGYKLQQKYKLDNTLQILIDVAKLYNEKVNPALNDKISAALKARITGVTNNTKPRAIISECPDGLLFNPDLSVCDYPENCIDCGSKFITLDDGTLLPVASVTASCYDAYSVAFEFYKTLYPYGYKAVFGEFATAGDRVTKMNSDPFSSDCYFNQLDYLNAIFDSQFAHDNSGSTGGSTGGGSTGGGSTGGGSGSTYTITETEISGEYDIAASVTDVNEGPTSMDSAGAYAPELATPFPGAFWGRKAKLETEEHSNGLKLMRRIKDMRVFPISIVTTRQDTYGRTIYRTLATIDQMHSSMIFADRLSGRINWDFILQRTFTCPKVPSYYRQTQEMIVKTERVSPFSPVFF